MIEISRVRELVEKRLESTEEYLVDVDVTPKNKIVVEVDGMEGISIKACVALSRFLEKELDREKEDFELEVTSPGLGQPFKVLQQYKKNVGREVELESLTGERIKGLLVSVEGHSIEIRKTLAAKPKKKSNQTIDNEVKPIVVALSDIKACRVVIAF